ncbi:MAG: hypothetical protein ABS911_03430 [Carnobacterium sp.]
MIAISGFDSILKHTKDYTLFNGDIHLWERKNNFYSEMFEREVIMENELVISELGMAVWD